MLQWATAYRYHLSLKRASSQIMRRVLRFWQHVSAHSSLSRWENQGPAGAQADSQPACIINNLPSLSVNIAMSEPIGMSYFSHAPTKYLAKKGGFNLTHSFKAQSIAVRRSWLQEAAGLTASTVREQRWTRMLSVRFLLFIQYETPAHEMVPPP